MNRKLLIIPVFVLLFGACSPNKSQQITQLSQKIDSLETIIEKQKTVIIEQETVITSYDSMLTVLLTPKPGDLLYELYEKYPEMNPYNQ